MKQTAVEWLHQIFKQREPDKFDWEQAKAMEKEQIDKAYSQGIQDKNEGLIKEEYYHQIYHPSIKKITITELNIRKQHIIDMMKDDEDLGLYSPI